MNPMKYRKAKWVKVPDGVTAAQIQVAAEQIDAMKRDQQVRIDHFMDDLKQLTEKHGISLVQFYEDIHLFQGEEKIGEEVDLELFTAHVYEPPKPYQGPRMMYPGGVLSATSESLKQMYLDPMLRTLNEPSPIHKLFGKGNGPS